MIYKIAILDDDRKPLIRRNDVNRWKEASRQVERDQLTKEFGVRWSELLRFPYFNPPRMFVIDPLHKEVHQPLLRRFGRKKKNSWMSASQDYQEFHWQQQRTIRFSTYSTQNS